jgi:O-antigen biosynthesis protein
MDGAVTAKRSAAKGAAKDALRTAFYRMGEGRFCGYVVDAADLNRRFTVEVLVDNHVIRVTRADAYVHELAQKSVGDGCYGFSVSLDARLLNDAAVVTAQLANSGVPVGPAIVLERRSEPQAPPEGPGAVRWLGVLRFSGWVSDDQDPATLQVLVDGKLIDRVHPNRWTHVGAGSSARAVRGFDVFLPARFGDGGVHQFAVVTAIGENLAGSPLTFVAFADGLRDLVVAHGNADGQGIRAALFDQLVPSAVPFSRYQAWRQRFPVVVEPGPMHPCAVVLANADAMEATLSSLEAQIHSNWVAAELPRGPAAMEFPAELVRDFLATDGADCAYAVFGLAGTVLAPTALQRIDAAFSTCDGAQIIFGDLDIRSDDGSVWPLALPAFDYERMLEQGYCSYLFAMPCASARRAIDAGASNLYRLFNAMLDDGGVSRSSIVHLPGSLGALPAFDRSAARKALSDASRAHLQRRGIAARITAVAGSMFPAVRIARSSDSRSLFQRVTGASSWKVASNRFVRLSSACVAKSSSWITNRGMPMRCAISPRSASA